MSKRFLAMLLYTPVACMVALVQPFYGLLALVCMYYFRPSIWQMPGWFRPVLFVTASVALGWAMKKGTFRTTPLMTLSYVVLIMLLVSAGMAVVDKGEAIGSVWIIAKLIVVQFLTLQLCDTPRKINLFLWANVIGMLWNLKTILVLGLGGGGVTEDIRVNVAVGQGGGSNYLAMVLVMTLPLFYVKLLNGERWEKRLSLVLAPIYVLCVVLCGSRGGYVALFVTAFYIVLKSNRKLMGSVALVFGALVVLVFMPETQWERLKAGLAVGDQQRDFAASSRLKLWGAGWKMFMDHPVTGVGPDNFSRLSPRYAGFYASKNYEPYQPGDDRPGFVAHSTWFQTLAEGGLLVSVPFFLMFLVCWRNLVAVRRMPIRDPPTRSLVYQQSIALEGLFVAFVIASTFGSHIKIDFLWWYFGLVSALQLATQDVVRREWAALQAAKGDQPPPRTRQRSMAWQRR